MQNSAKNFSQQRLKNILNAAFIAFKCQKQGEKNRPQRYLISFAKANNRQDWVFDKVCIFFVTQNV